MSVASRDTRTLCALDSRGGEKSAAFLDEALHVPGEHELLDSPTDEAERRVEANAIDHHRAGFRRLEAVLVVKGREGSANLLVDLLEVVTQSNSTVTRRSR